MEYNDYKATDIGGYLDEKFREYKDTEIFKELQQELNRIEKQGQTG